MLTLADLRYLLRLVQCDALDGTNLQRSLRVDGKLMEMIGRARRQDTIVDANISTTNPLEAQTTAAHRGRSVKPWTLTIYQPKGGGRMTKTSKVAPKMPKGKIGKAVKKK